MSFSSSLLTLGLFLAALSPVTAQTWTACNPMNKTNCPDDPALGMNFTWDFSQENVTDTWNTTAGSIGHGSNGGEFTINKRYDSPTIQSEFYIFFGVVEVHMRGATGQGIISSIVLESDDLDEVDWEMMGGNNTHVETNYFGKGNTTSFDRAMYHSVDEPLDTFHNYTVHWTSEKIEWYIDTVLTRTLLYAAANGGNNFPQTPMNIRLGIWAGGDPSLPKGTIEWAGGLTDFSKGPYTMYVKNVTAKDFSTGSAYHFSDKSGSFKSIKSIAGNSTTANTLLATPEPTTTSKWNSLSSGVKIGIYCAAGAVGAALLALISFCCIKQRRAGRREHAAYMERMEKERADAAAYTGDLKDADSLPTDAPTPSEFTRSNSTTSYTKSGADGFGSAGNYAAPPMPPMPTAYGAGGAGGLKSPSAGGFNSPTHDGFQNVSAYQNNNGYQSNRNYQRTAGYQNTRGYQNSGGFTNPTSGGFNNPRAYSGNGAGFPSHGNNGYFQQGYSHNGYQRQVERF